MARNERGGSRAGSSGQEDVESPSGGLSSAYPVPTASTAGAETGQTPSEGRPDIGQRDELGVAALMRAAAEGDAATVKRHLSDKDKKNSDGETALIIAARAGHKDIVELLDPTDENGFTALMRAAERDDPAAAEALLPLQGGMRTTGVVGIDGWWIHSKGTALMVAAVRGHTEVARLLLEREGGMSDFFGYTALMAAASNGHPDCVKLLLEKEEGMSASDGWTAFMWAAQEGHADCARLLEKEKHMRDAALRMAEGSSVVSLLSE